MQMSWIFPWLLQWNTLFLCWKYGEILGLVFCIWKSKCSICLQLNEILEKHPVMPSDLLLCLSWTKLFWPVNILLLLGIYPFFIIGNMSHTGLSQPADDGGRRGPQSIIMNFLKKFSQWKIKYEYFLNIFKA